MLSNSNMPKSRITPEVNEKKTELEEMRRLYEDELMTLREIGRVFGMTRQGVHNRFVAAGIPRRHHYSKSFIEFTEQRRERTNQLLIAHGDDILRMYLGEKLALEKIAKRLGIPEKRIRDHLVECEVEIRGPGALPKIPEIGKLKVGESVDLPKPTRKYNPHLTYYRMANAHNISVSLRSIDERTFRVTRIK
jgi:predicted DNA-binding protein YlxM (UPF0122 family)